MSKILLPIVCVAAAGFAVTATAQNPAPAKPTAPQATNAAPAAVPSADPFVRNPSAKPAATTPKEPEPPPVNILTTLETWSLSQADFAALLDGPADERAPVDRLEALAGAGKAKLLGVQAIATRPGQRTVVESIDELRYPTKFQPADRVGEKAFPTDYETRNAGETLELEPILGPDGRSIEINLVPINVRLHSFEDWKAEDSSAPQSQPQIQTEKLTTSLVVQSGRPMLLSTATPVEPGTNAETVRVRALRAMVEPVRPAAVLVKDARELRVDLLVYSVEREAARRILAESSDSVQSFAAVRELVAKGAAKLEAVSSFPIKSGNRAVNEETYEYRYPTAATPPGYDSQTVPKENRRPATFTSFETRNTGLTLEIETVLSPDERFVHINTVPQIVQVNGNVRGGADATNFPPQPLFTTRKLTTSVVSGAGAPVLLGTLSQPQETGVNDRKDDRRTSLAYIRVTPIRP